MTPASRPFRTFLGKFTWTLALSFENDLRTIDLLVCLSILREIEVLKQETFMLKEQMKNVREDLLKVEKNTVNDSMKLLLDLDIIRTNMINVQMSLQVWRPYNL